MGRVKNISAVRSDDAAVPVARTVNHIADTEADILDRAHRRDGVH